MTAKVPEKEIGAGTGTGNGERGQGQEVSLHIEGLEVTRSRMVRVSRASVVSLRAGSGQRPAHAVDSGEMMLAPLSVAPQMLFSFVHGYARADCSRVTRWMVGGELS